MISAPIRNKQQPWSDSSDSEHSSCEMDAKRSSRKPGRRNKSKIFPKKEEGDDEKLGFGDLCRFFQKLLKKSNDEERALDVRIIIELTSFN